MVEVKRRIDNLLRGLRRIAVEPIDRLPTATLIGLSDELHALRILKDQRLGHTAGHAGGGAREGLREAAEIADQGGQNDRIHAAEHAGVTGDSGVTLGHGMQRKRTVAVALERLVTR